MPILTQAALAFGVFVVNLTGSASLFGAAYWALKAGVIFAANALLFRRDKPPGIPEVSRVETFSSGPARWVVGRSKVGGVVMYWGEDWNVPETEGRGGPGADDLHLIIAVSEGSCDAIEAIWVAGERLEVKFKDDGTYLRRGERDGDTAADLEGLPLDLDPGAPTFWDSGIEKYRRTPGGDILDPDNEDDAELIRRADLSGAVNVYPYLDAEASNRWHSVRTYTDRADGAVLGNATPFTDWTTAHRLDGVAGLHIRLRQWTKHNFDEKVFKGAVPDLQFLIRGQRITFPDPDADSGMVTQWTNNAAAVRYWWHTERRGIPSDNIDRDAFVAAWKACETRITPSLPESWPDNRTPDWAEDIETLSFRRYSIDGVVVSGDSPASIEHEFNDAWQGVVVEDGGSFFYYPGIDRIDQPIAIEGRDLLELPSWQPAPGITERVNAVTLAIEQSSFHDFNRHALREIVDSSKREAVDEDLHLPHDLGSWRWTTNPAQAYSLGTITLRRARNAGTLSVKLPPGTEDDPIAYLTMSPGLVYTINIPEEGFSAKRMMLLDKQVAEDMSVTASFIEAPLGIYSPDYQLPDVPSAPAYVPTRMGTLPPKPTGLAVEHSAQVSNDGTIAFRIEASVDASPLRKIFRLTAGDDQWEIETASDSHVFLVNVPRQSMGVTARHIDKSRVRSLPARYNFTPDYGKVFLPRPLWEEVIVYGGSLRLVFERLTYGASVSGVEVRYTRLPLGSTGALPVLTEDNWDTAPVLRTEAVQIVRGLDVNLTAIATESGRYGLFARYLSNVSGAEPVRGTISYLRDVEIDIPEQPISTIEEAPLFAGSSTHLEKWIATAGDAGGEALLFPSHTPASSLRFDHWNGYVPDSAITASPLPRWPFGQCEGFGAALTATRDSFGIIQTSPSTTYTTPPIDLGVSKRVEVKFEIFDYTPGTTRQSNLTFGGHSISDQVWGSGAIASVTLPAASQGIGTIAYKVLGLPAGVTFTASTRLMSGTPLVNTAAGTARYIATDDGGGEAVIEFAWSIGTSVSAPGSPTALEVTAQQTSARLTWTAAANASTYSIQRASSASGPWTDAGTSVEPSFDLTGLTASTTYYVRVRASNGGGDSAWTSALSFTTPATLTAPATPTGLAEERKTGTSITVDWNSALGVTSYEVRWKEADAQNFLADHIATGLSTTEHTITGLASSRAYDIEVRARNAAGPSAWSSSVEITTATGAYSAPSITSVTAFDAAQDYLQIVLGAYSNLNSVEFEVTSDPPDGVHSATARSYTESPPGPYQIYNVKPGISYEIRARAIVQGGGVSDWSAWTSLVFGSVPSVPRSPSATATASSVSLTWTASASGSPTSYRIDYWPTATPSNVLFVGGISGTSRTITGLEASEEYSFAIKGVNSHGTGLAATIVKTTSAASIVAPAAPINRRAFPTSTSRALLAWSESEGATSYDVRHSQHPFTEFSTITQGVTALRFEFASLTPGIRYRPQIRARNSAGTSAWVNFPEFTMPTAASDYDFASNAPLTMSRGSGRTLNWSLQADVDAGVAHFQIRYRQSQHASLTDRAVPNWVVLPDIVPNTFSSGLRTFTGSFDPGYSNLYFEVQVRAYVDSAVGSTIGLSAWHPCSNTERVNNVTLSSVIRSGAIPLAAPIPSIEQSGSSPIIVSIGYIRNRAQFEYRDEYNLCTIEQVNGTYGSLDITYYDSAGRPGAQSFDAVENRSEGYYLSSDDKSARRNIQRYKTGDVLRIRNWARSDERQDVITYQNYTILDPAQNPDTAPDAIAGITFEREGGDVTFSWLPVAGADGYEVRLVERAVAAQGQTVEYVVQTGSGTDYEKIGGRNEHFTIKVRTYRGSGSGRLYSASVIWNYSPPSDIHSVGKVTGLEEDPVNNTTRLRWAQTPNVDGYQIQVTTNEGWGSPVTVASPNNQYVVQSAGDFTARIRGYRGSGADRVYGLSWSAIAHKEYTDPGPNQVGDVEHVTAIDREDDVIFDWDDDVPNAGRFRIERRAAGSNTWTVVQANISSTTTAWDTDEDASVSATYRIRGETDEANGAWTELEWTGSTLLPAGSITNLHLVASHLYIEARWQFPAGIYQAEVEYRKGSSGNWTPFSVGRYSESVTITGLDDNATYQVRVRAKAGERVGAWATASKSTLACVALAAPGSIFASVSAIDFYIVTFAAVTGATKYSVIVETSTTSSGPWELFEKVETTTTTVYRPIVKTRPYYFRGRVRAIGSGGCEGEEAINTRLIPVQNSDPAGEAVEGAIAAGSGASVAIPSGVYSAGESESSSPLARPWFDGYFEERCFLAGVAIVAFEIPAPQGGRPPYSIAITGLPAGVTFDPVSRRVSGTPTGSAPDEGYAVVRLEDANGAYDSRSIRWIIASPVPQSWSEFGGGFGAITNPFQIECTTKGNVRPFYFRAGGTNAAALEAEEAGADARVIWLRCPTTYPHTARLLGAGATDYDLVVKVGDDWHFSDSTDNIEFVRVPGHPDGALIGIFRYEATTTATGANNTGDPLTLEWYPDVIDAPSDSQGDEAVGASAAAGASTEATGFTGRTPGLTETDVYLLHRNGKTGAWTRRATALAEGWTDVGTNAREVRFEFHLKRWENRAVRRITTLHRDKS